MPTKISLALGPRQAPSRQGAWGCFTTNLTLPGFGTILAGRRIGYAQIAITVAGFALTTIFGLRFILWYFAHKASLEQMAPDESLLALWQAVRWALLGIALFAMAWLWALSSSMAILAAARAAERRPPPPRIPVPPII
jgi:hypothetical protein